jgi:acyl CoA:acetate/3-ketoacid CoA transferase alpha subunit
MRGYDKYFSDNVKRGRVKILSDWSHGLMALGFKAAQLGVPGLYSSPVLGSEPGKIQSVSQGHEQPDGRK